MKRIIISILIVGICLIGGPNEGAAKEPELVMDFINHGLMLLDKEDYSGAINDFSRALLLDPRNDEAKEFLLGISGAEGLNAGQVLNLLTLQDLLAQIQNLKEKVSYYVLKQKKLKEHLLRRGYEVEMLNHELDPIKDQIFSAREVQHLKSRESYLSQTKPLEAFNASLSFQKERLYTQLLYLDAQYVRLREINRSADELSRPSAYSKIQTKEISRPVTSQQAAWKLPSYGTSSGPGEVDDISVFKQELAMIHKQLSEMEGETQAKDQKVISLTRQLVESALKLTEKEMVLSQKINHLYLLNDELMDLRSRFELGQKIIQEKEEHIQSLEAHLLDVVQEQQDQENKVKHALSSKNEKLIELNGILKIYRSKLSDTTRSMQEKLSDINVLDEKLTYVEEELQERNQILFRTKNNLAILESQIADFQKKLSGIEKKDGKHEVVEIELMNLKSKLEAIHKLLLRQIREIQKINPHLVSQFGLD